MELTFVTELGQSFVIEIDPQMELENVMALLEAESGIPVPEQSISHEGRDLSNPKATMEECSVGDHAMLLLRRKVTIAGRAAEQDAEMIRLQILGDPNMMSQLRTVYPDLVDAAQNNPARFADLLRETHARNLETQREITELEGDPFNIEAQRRIEDAIRQQAVMNNFEHAMEYSPEGREVDLLFGLDMLKAHQACIDLERDCLRIQGREVRFLAEHELPQKARDMNYGRQNELAEAASASGSSGSTSGLGPSQSFPGAGHTLGATPAPARSASISPQYSEEAIQALMNLGASREVAIQTLDAAGGNLDVAASLMTISGEDKTNV
ncbi:uncharacterized protein FIBRA_00250 [Fibroporia radiculosa]|uniref:DNA damage-inducible protein 1 n=1 Tax=Fibroporia radiculosa TaxID=599839 RepID=J7SBZ2_9APHY|nr:uncharacterized protein FIBRA_00250 [Fibroporia radiculosa]CCL98256.1 predicted protein [Fibroporia radiculosa]